MSESLPELENRFRFPGSASRDEIRQDLANFLVALRTHRFYRFMVALGIWKRLDRRLQSKLERNRAWEEGSPLLTPTGAERIGIDLSALHPGGVAGGAQLVAVELARLLPRLARELDFVLLTRPNFHHQLAELESANVCRWLMPDDPGWWPEILLDRPPLRLLICPMTVSPWIDPRVPMISVIHDLQHLTYPDFFAADELANRTESYRRIQEAAQQIVTVSHYVRDRFRECFEVQEERITVIHNGLSKRFPGLTEIELEQKLQEQGLVREGFFLYPANPWPHKNHSLLLTAFGLFLERNPESEFFLVLTGASDLDDSSLTQDVRRSGWSHRVIVTGYVSDASMEVLLRACRALIYPSLYEGFGMPVIEAMSWGRPVLCSHCTSLPEVGGGAALYFDPRRPEEICGLLEKVAFDENLVENLAELGRARAQEIGDTNRMAHQYLELVQKQLGSPKRPRNAIAGLWEDGWSGRLLAVSCAEAGSTVELELRNVRSERVEIAWRAGSELGHSALVPGENRLLRIELPAETDVLEILFHPTLCPLEEERSDDPRRLGLYVEKAKILAPDGREVDVDRRG